MTKLSTTELKLCICTLMSAKGSSIKTCTGLCNAHWLLEYLLALGALAALAALAALQVIHLMHYLKRCACHSRTSYVRQMVLKIASLDSRKHHSLKHQTSCLMALQSVWGQYVSHVLLAGALTGHGHRYGLGTALLAGRHSAPGTNLTMSKCALYKLALTAYCKKRILQLQSTN